MKGFCHVQDHHHPGKSSVISLVRQEFFGKIKTWKELEPVHPIVLTREEASGTGGLKFVAERKSLPPAGSSSGDPNTIGSLRPREHPALGIQALKPACQREAGPALSPFFFCCGNHRGKTLCLS
jgi:hypothetical protein